MERAVKPGEAVKAKTRARLLSANPKAGTPGQQHLASCDLHAVGIAALLSKATTQGPRHIYAKPVVFDKPCGDLLIARAGLSNDEACTDATKIASRWLKQPFVLRLHRCSVGLKLGWHR